LEARLEAIRGQVPGNPSLSQLVNWAVSKWLVIAEGQRSVAKSAAPIATASISAINAEPRAETVPWLPTKITPLVGEEAVTASAEVAAEKQVAKEREEAEARLRAHGIRPAGE